LLALFLAHWFNLELAVFLNWNGQGLQTLEVIQRSTGEKKLTDPNVFWKLFLQETMNNLIKKVVAKGCPWIIAFSQSSKSRS